MKKIENTFVVTGFVGNNAEIRQFTNAKHVSMACAVINNGKPTGNIPFRMESVA